MSSTMQAGMTIELVEVFDPNATLLTLSEALTQLAAEEAALDGELLAVHKARQRRITKLKTTAQCARQLLAAHARGRGEHVDLAFGRVRLKALPPAVVVADEEMAIRVLKDTSMSGVVVWSRRLDKAALHKLSAEVLAEAGITIERRQVCEIQLLNGTRLTEDLP